MKEIMNTKEYLEFELQNYCRDLIPDYDTMSEDEKEYLLQRAELYYEDEEG